MSRGRPSFALRLGAPELREPLTPQPSAATPAEGASSTPPSLSRTVIQPDAQLMTAAEVGAFFRRSDRTIRAWDRSGDLRPHKIKGRKFYLWRDVARLAGLLPADGSDTSDQTSTHDSG